MDGPICRWDATCGWTFDEHFDGQIDGTRRTRDAHFVWEVQFDAQFVDGLDIGSTNL